MMKNMNILKRHIYLAKNKIMIDVNDKNVRDQLARDVYLEVNTIAFGLSNESKSVGTIPLEYVRAFNELMKDYLIYGQLKANYNTRYVSKEVKYNQIKDSIDNGVPATCSCGDTYTETHTFKTSLVMGKLKKLVLLAGIL